MRGFGRVGFVRDCAGGIERFHLIEVTFAEPDSDLHIDGGLYGAVVAEPMSGEEAEAFIEGRQ